MIPKTSKQTSWTLFTNVILLTTANLIFAAPPIVNDDTSSASRGFLAIPGGSSPVDFDLPMGMEQQNSVQGPSFYDSSAGTGNSIPQQPAMENAILNYLYAKHLMMTMLNSKLRSSGNGLEISNNELNRKRSYSKYCAFNAVSCFG